MENIDKLETTQENMNSNDNEILLLINNIDFNA